MPMTVAERIARIQKEISGVASQYGVTDWERTFLAENKDGRYWSPKREKVLASIERKAFGGDDDDG
jgi:hypothetical protein